MILTQAELNSLVQVRHGSPHALLGMHPLGDGSGVVARAFLPNAAEVELRPVREKQKPSFKLSRVHDSGLFEGSTAKANQVYAYELTVKDQSGNVRAFRDPYSFLPTLGESDLYLFGKGDERRI